MRQIPLKTLAEATVLFLPSLRLQRFGDQWVTCQRRPGSTSQFRAGVVCQARSRAIGEAITYLRPLAEKGVRIIFEAPKPIFQGSSFPMF